ncbi:MAG TPA: tetratricopeptide repeat protein, partial [Anaerolineales bacterium]|nr:tetratricopeptide repeat protein [Anaerolineales bacterium]
MSKSRSIPREPLEPVESFEDRLAVLAEELDLAIHWQRPSILLVFYESEYVRAEVELALQKGLTKTGQQVVEITVDESQFDVPLLLSRRPDRERSVYSITGLSWGGGRQDANAYRALNMRREFFVDYQIRAVFWLDKDEAAELPQQAPDFWAFRHRVVEFYDPPDRQALAFQVEEPAAPGPARPELGEEIVSAEARLACLPEVQESLQARLDSLGKLAGLYREKREPFQAVKHLKLALQLVRPTGDEKMSARLWGQLGQIYLDLGDQNRAVRAFRKAIRLLPDEAAFWRGLGQVYLAGGRAAAAR